MQISSSSGAYPASMSSNVTQVQQSSQMNAQSQKLNESEVQQSQQAPKVPVDGKGTILDIMA